VISMTPRSCHELPHHQTLLTLRGPTGPDVAGLDWTWLAPDLCFR
jgi:hypothetical protein